MPYSNMQYNSSTGYPQIVKRPPYPFGGRKGIVPFISCPTSSLKIHTKVNNNPSLAFVHIQIEIESFSCYPKSIQIPPHPPPYSFFFPP